MAIQLAKVKIDVATADFGDVAAQGFVGDVVRGGRLWADDNTVKFYRHPTLARRENLRPRVPKENLVIGRHLKTTLACGVAGEGSGDRPRRDSL